MEIKRLDFKFDGAVQQTGVFSGYGAVFGNVDLTGDIIAPGAFARSLDEHKQKSTNPPMLWSHDSREPIGQWIDFAEDSKGLFVTGKLNLDVQRGKEAYTLLKNKDISGLSIGFRTIESSRDNGARVLEELELIEISIVSLPANESARVDDVKSATILTERQCENALRDAGASRSFAKAIVSVGYTEAKSTRPQWDAADAVIETVVADLKKATAHLQHLHKRQYPNDSPNRSERRA